MHFSVSESEKISFIIGSEFSSFKDFPILLPIYLIILLAIPPTIIILSNLGIKFLIIFILDDTFEPPIIQVIGFLISEVIFFKASTSKSSCNPEYEGKKLVTLWIDACAL